MQQRSILKLLDKATDLMQLDLEESKKNADMQVYRCYVEAINNLKHIKNYVEFTLPQPKGEQCLPTQKTN